MKMDNGLMKCNRYQSRRGVEIKRPRIKHMDDGQSTYPKFFKRQGERRLSLGKEMTVNIIMLIM